MDRNKHRSPGRNKRDQLNRITVAIIYSPAAVWSSFYSWLHPAGLHSSPMKSTLASCKGNRTCHMEVFKSPVKLHRIRWATIQCLYNRKYSNIVLLLFCSPHHCLSWFIRGFADQLELSFVHERGRAHPPPQLHLWKLVPPLTHHL